MGKEENEDLLGGYQALENPDGEFEDQLEYEEDDVQYRSSKFAPAEEHKDWMFAAVFVLHVLAVCTLSVVTSSHKYEVEDSSQGVFSYEQRVEVMEMTVVCCVIALLTTVAWLMLVQFLSSHFILFSLFAFVAMNLVVAVVAVVTGPYGLAFTALVSTICCFWFAISVRSRVPFSAALFKLVVGIVRLYPACVLVAMIVSVMQLMWVVVWSFLSINLLTKGNPVSTFELCLLVLSLFWTSQVLKNIVHVTVSGTVAMWYFMHETGMPLNPTVSSFRRAVTTSFGSICMGSLLISVFRSLRFVVAHARQSNNRTLTFFASCVMRVLDHVMSYFNTYALTQVAIYGKSYVEAGKDTWQLMRSRGVDAVINTELVGVALTFVCIVSGIFTALCGGLWAYQHDNMDAFVVSSLCFSVGYCITLVVAEVVESGVACLFVCYAEDPDILSRADPVMFSLLREGCCVERPDAL